jgi:hypothetical protein
LLPISKSSVKYNNLVFVHGHNVIKLYEKIYF